MNDAKQLHDWLDCKIRSHRYRLRVPARAAETFRRHTGPRYVFGQVTLSAVPAEGLGYSSRVTWPAGEQVQLYEDCVLEGILDAIILQPIEPVLGIAVTLEEIAWHEVDSCAGAYHMAAQQAMQQILSAGGRELAS
ncbi:MAG TPA: hypothetical protein VN873_03765 [Candidatus Angelobacter sp.]|nr:hypothetical protein [Candidatus Angelobacter sp.]